jgi:hypothetical protein
MNLSAETWVSIVAAAGSLVAVFFAYRSTRIANLSLRISQEQADARKPKLVPYLIDGFLRTGNHGEGRIYAFSVLLSNRADADNALARIDLRITYTRRDKSTGNVLLEHDPALSELLGIDGATPFRPPLRVPAHDTISAWTTFRFAHSLAEQVDVTGYEIRFIDSHGLESSVEPLILREIIDETTVAER